MRFVLTCGCWARYFWSWRSHLCELATANAIFYAAPLIMLPLAAIFFGAQLSKQSVAAAVMGFAGVLVIIRPDQIDWAAISAFVVALTLAVNNLLIRKLPKNQSVDANLADDQLGRYSGCVAVGSLLRTNLGNGTRSLSRQGQVCSL